MRYTSLPLFAIWIAASASAYPLASATAPTLISPSTPISPPASPSSPPLIPVISRPSSSTLLGVQSQRANPGSENSPKLQEDLRQARAPQWLEKECLDRANEVNIFRSDVARFLPSEQFTGPHLVRAVQYRAAVISARRCDIMVQAGKQLRLNAKLAYLQSIEYPSKLELAQIDSTQRQLAECDANTIMNALSIEYQAAIIEHLRTAQSLAALKDSIAAKSNSQTPTPAQVDARNALFQRSEQQIIIRDKADEAVAAHLAYVATLELLPDGCSTLSDEEYLRRYATTPKRSTSYRMTTVFDAARIIYLGRAWDPKLSTKSILDALYYFVYIEE